MGSGSVPFVNSSEEILETIRRDEDLNEMLAASFEFDIDRGDDDQSARLSSSEPLESIAGDFTGGTFYLCGSPDSERPVLYASSEGQAGLIAGNLHAALEIIVGLPYWRDCLTFSGDGDLAVMTKAAESLQRDLTQKDAEKIPDQKQAAETLSLDISRRDKLLARLHEAVSRSAPDHVFQDESGEYEGLFGSSAPDDSPQWR